MRTVEFQYQNATYESGYSISGDSIEDVGLAIWCLAWDGDWIKVEHPSTALIDAAQKAAEDDVQRYRDWAKYDRSET